MSVFSAQEFEFHTKKSEITTDSCSALWYSSCSIEERKDELSLVASYIRLIVLSEVSTASVNCRSTRNRSEFKENLNKTMV